MSENKTSVMSEHTLCNDTRLVQGGDVTLATDEEASLRASSAE